MAFMLVLIVCVHSFIVTCQAHTKPLRWWGSQNSLGSTPVVRNGMVAVTATHFTAEVPDHPHEKQV